MVSGSEPAGRQNRARNAPGIARPGLGRFGIAAPLLARILSAVLTLVPATPIPAAGMPLGDPLETEIKAAMIINFTYFIRWEAGSGRPLSICIANSTQMLSAVRKLTRAKQQEKRTFQVEAVSGRRPVSSCDIVYVHGTSPAEEAAVLDSASGLPVLTMGDSRSFAERGGAVGFFIEQNRIRFAVNVDTLQKSGLVLSSKVLSLAHLVGSPSGKDGAP